MSLRSIIVLKIKSLICTIMHILILSSIIVLTSLTCAIVNLLVLSAVNQDFKFMALKKGQMFSLEIPI